MIQVSRRSWNGSIKCCRIHNLLRELAIKKAKEDNFLQIISDQGDQSSYSRTNLLRRATLHCDREDIVKSAGSNLRSLLYFGDHMPNLAGFRYLKVLYQMTREFRDLNWNIPKGITQLRYLGSLSSHSCVNFRDEMETLKRIGRMRNLQTLDFRNYSGDTRVDCIWNIETLRHVILDDKFEGPPSAAYLPNLQTLKTVRFREEWTADGWPKMPSIRVLRLYGIYSEHDESFRIFLNRLHDLRSLHISVYPFLYEVLDISAFPSYNHIQSLHVEGKWDRKFWNQSMSSNKLDIRLFPINLIKLTLCNSQIEEDPMPVLEKLKDLRKLTLDLNAYVGKQLSCSAGGFPRLEYLKLSVLKYLENWEVGKEGMPLLKEIFITTCKKLVAIPELQHMTTHINKLTLREVHPDLHERLKGEKIMQNSKHSDR